MGLLVWERERERKKGLRICVEKQKQLQPCNHRKWHMTFRTQFVPYSNPRCKLPNQSPMTTSFSSFPLCRQHVQAKGQTFSAWPICKIGYIFQGQMPHVTLGCTPCMRGEIKSMGCELMEPVRRSQRSGVNTAGLSFDTFYLQRCSSQFISGNIYTFLTKVSID